MSGGRVVTEADVREAAKAGRALIVPSGAIVTPAARDLARSLGISLAEADTGRPSRLVVALGAALSALPRP